MVTFPFIYISAVFVAIILGHQERRHYRELQLEYELLGRSMPMPKPKIPKLESCLTIIIGIIITLFSFLSLAASITLLSHNLEVGDEQITFSTVFLATGFTITIFGIRSIRQYRRYEKVTIKTL